MTTKQALLALAEQCEGAGERTCLICGTAITAKANAIARGRGKYCSNSCSATGRNLIRHERRNSNPDAWFWDKVEKQSDDACWIWKGAVRPDRGGYGRLIFKGKYIGAHRMALIIASGEHHHNLFACHRCDNPPCCNPSHLYWGSPLENVNDRDRRGRFKTPHPKKFLREELVALRDSGFSYNQLAERFGVNQSSIAKALRKLGLNGPIRPNQNNTSCLKAMAMEMNDAE